MDNKLENALRWIVSVLRKHDVPFQISGGLAANVYGSKRPVNDVDLDVPEDKMEFLLPDIQQYITFGPAQYKDDKWDLKTIALNYNGQEIDIGGAFEAKVFDEKSNKWNPCLAKLETAQTHTIYGIQVPVIDPIDLIEYKKLLSGEHQKEDINVVRNYISSNC